MNIFFRRKAATLPDFWRNYELAFKEKTLEDLNKIRFVVLDTETTGFDYQNDRILCIGALTLQEKKIQVANVLDVYLQQEYYNKETAKVHGILKEEKNRRITEVEALEAFLGYIGNAVLIAHHAKFDITMIDHALKRNGLPKLKNKVLDTSTLYKKTLLNSPLVLRKERYSLDELADKFDISKKDRHTALGDAYITALLFLKIMARLSDKKIETLRQLQQL